MGYLHVLARVLFKFGHQIEPSLSTFSQCEQAMILEFCVNMQSKKLHSSFRIWNVLLAEKHKATVLGKKNYSSIDKRYKVAGYTEENAQISICLCRIDRSIAYRLITLGVDRKKRKRFCRLRRPSCVGKVMQRVVERNNVQCSAITPKRRKKCSF